MKEGILICFLGIDGSGKSTLSKYLYEELKNRKYNVSYTWWLEGEDSLLRKLLRRVGKSAHPNLGSVIDNSNARNGTTITTKSFRVLYPKIVLLDYLRFGVVKVWLPKIVNRNKIWIFDRFFYDIILALSKEFDFTDFRRAKLFGIFSKLLPSPDLIFIIDVPPEVSYLRKKEEIKSIENAQSIWENYQELFSVLDNLTPGKIIRIDNTRELETVKAEILDASLGLLEMRKDG